MKARELMTSPVLTLSPESTLGEAAEIMLKKRSSALPVMEAGKVVGILSHTDYTPQHPVHPMANNLVEVLGELVAGGHLEDVAETMLRNHAHRLPVMRGKEMVGIVSRHDLLKLVVEGL